jgi:Methyltransferase domain
MVEHETVEGSVRSKRKLLFFLRGVHYDRVLENILRALLERGHEIHVALAAEKRGFADKTKLFDGLAKQYAFSYEQLEPRRDRWLVPAVALRHGIDYLRYLEPEYDGAEPLRERARMRAPRLLRSLLTVPGLGGRFGRRAIGGTIRRMEAAVPVPRGITELIESHRPDAVLVSPLVGLGSIESDYVRAAQELGIPTVLVVASWDNLTNKGVIRDAPAMTIVWNQTQVEEAVRLHSIPRDQVVAVGAHSFDHWFTWRASTTREGFAGQRDLDPARPLVLYLGSSFFISGDETGYIREWLRRVREHPRLREVAVLFRPHPQNVVGWDELDVDEPGKTVVWPRAGEEPRHERQKQDYFDSLFHSTAMVGISTTALIEAAILHRPVLTFVSDYFQTQEGTLHFSYIAHDGDGGLVTVGRSWDEHLDQLADAIEAPESYETRIDAFLVDFVRPNGLDLPAAPAAADAVERASELTIATRKRSLVLRPVLIALTPVLWVATPLFHPAQTRRSVAKWFRLQMKWARRQKKGLDRAIAQRRKQAPALDQERKKEVRAVGKDARKVKTKGPKTKAAGGGPAEHRAEAKRRKEAARRSLPLRARGTRFVRKVSKRGRRLGPVMRRRWKRSKANVRTVYNMRYRRTYRSSLRLLPSRNELPALLNARNLVGRGAEIGVKTGKFSDHLLRRWKGQQLISIDPWLSDDPDAYVDRSNVSQDEFERYFDETKERLAPYGARSKIWRLTSVDAAERVADGSLDFVYIDARHDYASVLEDLNAWFRKVKPGGIFAGHDYVDGMLPQGDFGVKSAVDEFFAERNLAVHGTEGPSAVEQFPSWVVEIPPDGGRAADVSREEPRVLAEASRSHTEGG